MLFKKNKKKIISFLVSGRGSNFNAVATAILNKKINAKIGIVISNKIDAHAIEIAKGYGIKNAIIPSNEYKNRNDHEAKIIKLLKENSTDLIVLAGYMRLLSPMFISEFRNKIINIHPSLLPAFPGKDAQKQAFEYGVKITGCTCHYVDEGMDTGKIINQATVRIDRNDTISSLSGKILKEEHKLLINSIKEICS